MRSMGDFPLAVSRRDPRIRRNAATPTSPRPKLVEWRRRELGRLRPSQGRVDRNCADLRQIRAGVGRELKYRSSLAYTPPGDFKTTLPVERCLLRASATNGWYKVDAMRTQSKDFQAERTLNSFCKNPPKFSCPHPNDTPTSRLGVFESVCPNHESPCSFAGGLQGRRAVPTRPRIGKRWMLRHRPPATGRRLLAACYRR